MPLEQALNGVEGSTRCGRSRSAQLSSIVLIFEPGTDLLEARQLVQERIATRHADPADAGRAPPVMLQPLSATSRVMKIGMTSDDALADRACR